MSTAEQILAVARNELGNVEAPDGSNKYGRAYGVDRVAWCMQFCWWVFREAAASGLIHPKTAYTPTAAQWFRDRGRFDTAPRVGDLVFYNWPDSVNRIQHVGIVEAVEPAAIITIEGNTSTSNQSDGGRVMRRRRARNSSIVGYGHPAYTATPSPTPRDWFDMATEADLRRVLAEALTPIARRDDIGHARNQIMTAIGVDDPVAAPPMRKPEDNAKFALARRVDVGHALDQTRVAIAAIPTGSVDTAAVVKGVVDAITAQGLGPLVADELARRLTQ